MLQVSGVVAVSSKTPVEEVKQDKGSFFNFTVVSQDAETGKKTVYPASLWAPNDELLRWREEIQPGNVFHLQLGHWVMQEYEGGKYPIPKLRVSRIHFKRMVTAYWLPQNDGD